MPKNDVLAALVALTLVCASRAHAETAPAIPRVKLERVIPKMDNPVSLLTDPNGRMMVVEKTGRVRIIRPDFTVDPQPYLDLSKDVHVEFECGLLSIAFHPRFAENGLLYADYIAKRPNYKSFISEFKTEPKSSTVDKSTERVVLTQDQPFPNHKGGQLQFGPRDGMLYVGFGDGGGQKDPNKNGQNPKVFLGKILRIDVTPREGYAIPKDNPFVGDDKYRPEIWAVGMRNPWRFSFDEPTGLLYAADVGQDIWEEIDVIEKGKNYGWSAREGFHEYNPIPDAPAFSDPIFEYEHGTKEKRFPASVTGGYVYRGKKIPALVGCYIFADYVDGRVWAIRYEGGKVIVSDVIVDPKNPEKNGGQRATQPSGFGIGPDGELYMLDANGPVYRIAPAE